MDPEQTEPKRHRRALVPGWVPVVAGIVAALAVAAVTLPLLLARPETTTVPNIAGLDVAVARSRLGEAGLLLVYGDVRFSSTVPENGVVEQDPAPGGVVPVRTAVVVILSAGSEEFVMPDVLGMKVAEALTLLEERGLTVRTEPTPSTEPSGTVLASVPSPGATVRTSDTIRLSVAASRQTSTTLRPYSLGGMSFVLDPAEMPAMSGAASGTPDASLEVSRRLHSLLEASGATVTVTRSVTDGDGTASEPARIARASATSSTALIGLAVAPSGGGIRVTTAEPSAQRPALFIPSSDLARRIAEALKGARLTAPFSTTATDAVLTASSSPSVRVVLGSVSSAEDRSAFRDPEWADRVARSVYRAIGEAFGR